ncbi:excinuclease ABC subunit UvrC [Candidatus Viadribacter manganicus]|uniref:UvrABC system protein C n=1 Tax=Candidatus Viadribacter manganicus TaxID=1759059 RepID=A0A1B1AK65_9PROT|nr:excinuclease ABC subunit UvrC [Candidatus Viadribacter manganicus]ANP46935.1 excinuclease ABC subunit C [Candidatus Viadribacter manganicus]
MSGADKPTLPSLEHLPSEDAPTPAMKGIEAVRDTWKRLPTKPGVYRMLGTDGEVLYVGKAKNLKNRVGQYAQGRGHTNAIHRMIHQTVSMEVIVTATETEALLLETNMIKRLRPRYNVLMRDDKSFPYIAIRTDHAVPVLQKHRGAKSFKGKFYGPFASAGAVNRTLNTLQKAFLLRSCSDSTFSGRTRPCMLYQIKRCSAPCTELVSEAEYAALVKDSVDFLEGRSAALQDRLAIEMREAAEKLEFEHAARLRNRIRALASVRASQGINPHTFDEADVFALYVEGGQSCIQVFFFRAGQNWGNRAYFPRHGAEEAAEEILSAFIAQFYDDREPPKLVLSNIEPTDRELLEEALCVRAECKVEIRKPERGEKREIVDAALLNAREALGRRMAETGSVAKLLDGVAEVFGLSQRPERIEVYDNSHIQGTNALGAMIVAGPEGFTKNQYRKFNMKSEEFQGDDFAMMKAMIRRRFARMLAEREESAFSLAEKGLVDEGRADDQARDQLNAPHPPTLSPQGRGGAVSDGGVDFSKERDESERDTKFGAWPDLVLIDGGDGQLNAALEALDELGLKNRIIIAGIAKGVDRDAGRERFFIPGKPAFRLDEKSPVLYYLQRLRDEAHRFAIGAHRGKRSAGLVKNPLDEIGGIGPARKRALLDRFGSARGVSRAALAELEAVEGVNTELAKRIYDFFHDNKR